MTLKPKKIAIIGAGLAGVTAANTLAAYYQVQLFEKSRGAGGRMSSRRLEPFQFNHGAQFFTARSDDFNAVLASAQAQGIVAPWSPRLITLDPNAAPFKRTWFETHYVATAGMNGLAKYLAADLPLNLECEITRLVRVDASWFVVEANGNQHGPFDWVICAAPAPQTRALLPNWFSAFNQLDAVQFSACFALMLGFSQPVEFGFDAATIKNSAVAWAATTTSKTHSALLVHSENSWAGMHIEQDLQWVQQAMLAELIRVLPKPLPTPNHLQVHRWRFARCEAPLSQTYLLDGENGLGVCGDWCGGNRVEDAFTSGMSLANRLKTFDEENSERA